MRGWSCSPLPWVFATRVGSPELPLLVNLLRHEHGLGPVPQFFHHKSNSGLVLPHRHLPGSSPMLTTLGPAHPRLRLRQQDHCYCAAQTRYTACSPKALQLVGVENSSQALKTSEPALTPASGLDGPGWMEGGGWRVEGKG